MRYIIINGKTLDIYKYEHLKNTDFSVLCSIEQDQTGVSKYYMIAKRERIVQILKTGSLEGKIDLTGEVMLLTAKEFAERMKQVISLQQRIEQILGSPEKSWEN